jgi:signal peptidase II
MLPLFLARLFGVIDLWIELVYNSGAAWGTLSEYSSYLVVARILITAFVLYQCILSATVYRRAAFSLVLAGAMGNLSDTFLYQKVVDMIHFTFFGQSFGIFNVADASIFLGIVALFFAKKVD